MIVVACVLMTLALLIYIFSLPPQVDSAERKTRLAYMRKRKETIYENLRDLNFEYKAGKMPEADYLAMRASLVNDAAALLAEIEVREDAVRVMHLELKGAMS